MIQDDEATDDLANLLESGDRTRSGHAFRVTPTDSFGLHSGRRRYRVDCLTCGEVAHEATTGPSETIERHLRERGEASPPTSSGAPAPAVAVGRSEGSRSGDSTDVMPKVLAVSTDAQMSILQNPGGSSIKRIAWAYGCAKKGSQEEEMLLRVLLARIRAVTP